MKCFYHPESDAVGICKACQKGLCPECAVDVGNGLACKEKCEDEVRAINEFAEKNKTLYQKAAGANYRNAVLYGLSAALFLVPGLFFVGKNNAVSGLLIIMGIFFFLGSLFSYISGRKLSQK